jgi:hypothetical protein
MRAACITALLISCLCRTGHAQEQNATRLSEQLRAKQAERADASVTLPMIVVGAGLLAVVVAAGVGTGAALSCDGCEMPTWIGPVVIAGGGIATLGAIWWIHEDRDITELDHQIARLRDELRALSLRESFTPATGGAELSGLQVRARWDF